MIANLFAGQTVLQPANGGRWLTVSGTAKVKAFARILDHSLQTLIHSWRPLGGILVICHTMLLID